MDFLKCQTSTATPAEPGGFPDWANDTLGISEKLAECLRRLKALQRRQMYLDGWRVMAGVLE